MIGTIGFHGPPDASGRLEIGYSVQSSYRRQGFAREAVRAMLDWAAAEHGIHQPSSISPTNEASLALTRDFGFRQTGEQMDEIDGLELVFRRPGRQRNWHVELGGPSGPAPGHPAELAA